MAPSRIERQVDRLLNRIEEASEKGAWESVAEDAETILRLDPGNADALAYLEAARRDTDEAPRNERPPAGAFAAERRHMTVLFCDLVDSTPLAEQLDPEDMRELLRNFQLVAASVIERNGGYVAHYIGDGILVYFGFPKASEDDAIRAVRAGMALVHEVKELSDRLKSESGFGIATRVGIHSGVVVVGEMGTGSRLEPSDIVGETPNIAARLQNIAKPDSVVLSEQLANLLRGAFRLKPLGESEIKGISRPLRLFEPVGVTTDLDAVRREPVGAPIVGRRAELDEIVAQWDLARNGEGRAVLIGADAGLGKSRMVDELQARIGADSHTRIQIRCSALHQPSALHPVIEHVKNRVCRITPEDTPDESLSKLQHALSGAGMPTEMLPLMANLLSIETQETHDSRIKLPDVRPEELRRRMLSGISAWLVREAERKPVLLVIEDMHWADPSLIEMAETIIGLLKELPLFMVMTTRPDFAARWEERRVHRVELRRLSDEDAHELLETLPGGEEIDSSVRAQIVLRSDGVPLYLEELLKAAVVAIDSASGGAGGKPATKAGSVPATLQDSLMARLDRMNSEKSVAQVASALGRTFTLPLLRAVATSAKAALETTVGRLVEAGILREDTHSYSQSYSFKHALLQDVAYESMLRRDRAELHGNIARALQEHFHDIAEHEPEVVAHHLTEAGLVKEATEAWLRAARRAMAASANHEAIAHLQRALEISGSDSVAAARVRSEIQIRTLMGPALIAARGYAHKKVEENYERALVLCDDIGSREEHLDVLNGFRRFLQVAGRLERAWTVSDELVQLAKEVANRSAILLGTYGRANSLYGQGRLHAASEEFEAALQLGDQDGSVPRELNAEARESRIHSHSNLGVVSWMLGLPDRALQEEERARELAGDSPYMQAYAASVSAQVYQLRGETRASWDAARVVVEVGIERGFPYWAAVGQVFQAWVRAKEGPGDEAVSALRSAVEQYRSTGAVYQLTYFWGLLADAHLAAGDVEGGLEAVELGLTIGAETGEHYYTAELIRLKGELLLASEPADESDAEDLFRMSLRTAEANSSLSLELRAATSLARLLMRRQRKSEAQKLLAPIHARFTEGFETEDLRTAAALLT